ncbi:MULTISPECIES: hypothetical protein [unclassified Undibacterium]|uniref:hypothetical protein n=1 Tax=unclassified Undibacterium TaxID=2630295 RepID=UPI002AC980C2|nr:MULTISPECIES: hypothetical protein [unclassified Undibacterium]MEB0138204.1 hypothetical protein [Undibacterium sp. CCC2.1]MEB0173977.1 hypothetical protein [Undibacterium sp. CCC1.1]MEB0176807.1 hypothetical protein [Undibacterium sp. CCC3.4]MEB0217162.1 hypothetical protein [Undibacterium sp. 5I2]WPX45322.1 hypothetical protein RHM61_08945 [Undibacterium sp. CCC3.4]
MNTLMPHRRRPIRAAAEWGSALILLGAASGAMAAPPPANTPIGNQATAAYVDASGAFQLASSNLVQTLVQQVGSFKLEIDNVKSAASSGTVYAAHTLTNTGNGGDSFTLNVTGKAGAYSFTKVEVYNDVDGNGMPDTTTPLCTATATGVCTITPQTVAGNGGTFKFVVAYTVPGTAADGAVNTAVVRAEPENKSTAFYGTYAPNFRENTDTISVTTAAAFSATKALAAPSVAAPSGKPWPLASISGPTSSGASCATAFATITPGDQCQYTVYTINYTNTGASSGKFYLSDTLPAGMTYVTGSAVWSGASGVALQEGIGPEAQAPGINYVQTGNKVSALVDDVGPNVSGSLSFVVLVNKTATVGITSTTNTATYDPISSTKTPESAPPGSSSTNATVFTVTPTFGVVLGSSTGSLTASLDSPAGTPNATPADLTTVPSAAVGSSVAFASKLFNSGNAADVFNLSVASSTFPSGTVYNFYASDGRTPLLDTNSDGTIDAGVIDVGGSRNIVVRATIPGNVAPASGPYELIVRAVSAGDSKKFDATKDVLAQVTGILVDLTNTATGSGVGSVGNGDLGAGPSPLATTTMTTEAGTGTVFHLFVKNSDTIDQTYKLEGSQTPSFSGGLPAGWTVKFVTAGASCSGAAVTSVAVAKGTQTPVDACVTPPVGAPAATTTVYFKVTSQAPASTGATVSDIITDAVKVTNTGIAYSATLSPDQSGQIAPAGTVTYSHVLSNIGTLACGSYKLSAEQSPAAVAAGWISVMYLDVNGNGQVDSGDTLLTDPSAPLTLAVGAQQKILVKMFAPGGVLVGDQNTVRIVATFDTASCAPTSVTDTTTVVTGQMRVSKTQLLDPTCSGVASGTYSASVIANAQPGQCVLYRVIAVNEGVAPIANLTINDSVPNYTTLSPTQPAVQCVAKGMSGDSVAYDGSKRTTVSCGSTTNAVPPGASLQLDFAVEIDK